MKKEGVILVLVIVLLLSISLVSASFWNDFWNKITGRVIEENITPEPSITEPKVAIVEPEPKSEIEPVEEKTCPSIPVSMWCPDEKTLCPQTKDEKGCLVWNCDACEAEPKEDKIICCAITPILEEPVPTSY